MNPRTFDVAIVGGGIVGMATALSLVRGYSVSLVVLEAEDRLAGHQTGNNSGVIHSGLYYKPGSQKARNCVLGREAMYRFCQEHGVPCERCGKIVVAVEERELPALDELERRGLANGLKDLVRLGPDQIREHEPHVRGIAGLFVPETGIVDYKAVTAKYGQLVRQAGGDIRLSARVLAAHPHPGEIVLETRLGEVRAKNLITCGGLEADRVARLCGLDPGLLIVPFRGEYYELVPERCFLVKNLIYPVPDPRFPFLGVHFTRMIGGRIEAGPNAVLALQREGYSWKSISPRDLWQMAAYKGFWRMAGKHWKMGLGEVYRSINKRAFHRALARLVPELALDDIQPAGAGVRAQALEPSGLLVDDFRLIEAQRMIHVLNAPSPAATASLAIGNTIADMTGKNFTLTPGRMSEA
jgi:(S)-2-hydroxyglutarate dehydrogenase